jgi:hypothetical protein
VKALEVLARKWRQEETGAFPPCGEAVVHATFLAAGIAAPRDLVHLYGVIGGMEVANKDMWRLWPLSEVDARKTDATEYGVLFSDYLIESWVYRIKPNDTNTSSVYVDYANGQPPILVARTLEQFFETYESNPDKLLTEAQ